MADLVDEMRGQIAFDVDDVFAQRRGDLSVETPGFVVPAPSRTDLEALSRGERLLDGRTRDFIRDHLAYRVVTTSSGTEARARESYVRKVGLPRSGRPTINP